MFLNLFLSYFLHGFFSNIIMTIDIYLAVYLSHFLHLKCGFYDRDFVLLIAMFILGNVYVVHVC